MKSLSRQAADLTAVNVVSWETRWFECKVRRRLDELPGAVVLLHDGMIVEINTRASAILERPAEQILSHRLEEFACADDGPKLTRWLEWELLSPLLVGAVRKGKGSVALWLQQHGHFIYRGRRVCMTLIDTGECPAGIGAKTDCLLLKATDLGYLNWKHYEASPKKQWSG